MKNMLLMINDQLIKRLQVNFFSNSMSNVFLIIKLKRDWLIRLFLMHNMSNIKTQPLITNINIF